MATRSFEDWLEYQNRVHSLSMDFTLERIREVLRRLNLLKPRARVITVGGTNGKGSVTAMIESMARAHGLTTGLYTSPHLLDYSERIKINGKQAPHAELIRHFENIEAARGEFTLTFFEFATVAALAVFAEAGVDLIILEVGLGGRLDAVNVIDADVAVVASVSLDHQELLGNSLEAIGQEKAGIFRSRRKALFGALDRPESIDRQATSLGAELLALGRDFGVSRTSVGVIINSPVGQFGPLTQIGLSGDHQWENAATAVTALGLLPLALEPSRVNTGLRQVQLRGRFEQHVGKPNWVFDVAHNPGSVKTLVNNVLALGPHRRVIWIGGLLIEKDATLVALALNEALLPKDRVIAVGLQGERARSAGALQAIWSSVLSRTVEAIEDLEWALQTAREQAQADDWVVVFGSFHVVAPALAWFEQQGQKG